MRICGKRFAVAASISTPCTKTPPSSSSYSFSPSAQTSFHASATSLNKWSSPFTNSTPPSGNSFIIFSFSRRIFSCVPSCSIWETPILVITAHSGRATRTILAISPGILIPISITAISCLSERRHIMRGRPTWLFIFPSVFRVQNPVDSAIATISFVVVLPTLPVTPTTGIPKVPRTCAPKRCNASTFGFFSPGISIYTTAISSGFNDSATSLRHVKVALIPCAPASLIKSCASTCSPITGTNMVAASPTLESVENSVILIPPSPAISSPPTISAISLTVYSLITNPFLIAIML